MIAEAAISRAKTVRSVTQVLVNLEEKKACLSKLLKRKVVVYEVHCPLNYMSQPPIFPMMSGKF